MLVASIAAMMAASSPLASAETNNSRYKVFPKFEKMSLTKRSSDSEKTSFSIASSDRPGPPAFGLSSFE